MPPQLRVSKNITRASGHLQIGHMGVSDSPSNTTALDTNSKIGVRGDLGDGSGSSWGGKGAAEKEAHSSFCINDKPPPADEVSRDDNDLSAPAVVPSGHGEYSKRPLCR